ncbi:MAG TPA: type II secretion system F family protein, partial [Candidatus Melainabacteria bacterium]|nr:type II secretion system F family protein [Candidatus Melainabacteria bacterium]
RKISTMSAAMQYPEFILAFCLGLVFLVKNQRSPGNLPLWLTAPALVLMRRLPVGYQRWLAKLQLWSGWRSNTAFGALAAAKIYPVILTGFSGIFLPLWLTVLLTIPAFFTADLVLLVLSRRRKARIKESLPQALDLMVLCVDAGLGLDATISRIASEKSAVRHDLNDELMILGRDILLGMEREKAYQDLYSRTGVEELKSLGASLNQAAQLGISISKILRAQSEFLRTKLSQQAEEKAAKLPIYMAFPLWFCIMPALMVIVLAPSFITFFEYIKPMMFR